jgi:hypothetical protein
MMVNTKMRNLYKEYGMKAFIKLIFLWIATTLSHTLVADHIINLFLRPYPHFPVETAPQELAQQKADKKSAKLRSLHKTAQYTLRSAIDTNAAAGLFATYAGQLSVSSINGQLVFARRQESPNVHLLVTEKIDPIFQVEQTIHHWELEAGVPAALYAFTQDREQDTDIEYWDVKRVPLPQNRSISIDTIVVFAQPTSVYVPEGITPLKHPGADLFLPDVFVKKSVDTLASSLYLLNLKRLFSQTQKTYQVKENSYRVIVH